MCMVVYIAADKPLPTIAWDPDNRQLNVMQLKGEREENVRSHFSKPHVYYVGSHLGCGCGFSYGQHPDFEKEEEAGEARTCVADLSAYLKSAIAAAGPVELYACWSGDEGDSVQARREATYADIGGEAFWLEERVMLVVS